MKIWKRTKIFLFFFVITLSLFTRCSAKRKEVTEVNFSVAVCSSLNMLQVSRIPLLDGTTTFLINCQTSVAQLGNVAIIFYSDGEVSLAPIDQQSQSIDLVKRKKLLSAKAFLHTNAQIDSTYNSDGKDLIVFGKNVQEADISLVYFVSKDSDFFKFILDGLSSVAVQSELINKKNYVFIYTHLSTKNLSSIVSPIFDEIIQFAMESLKVSDLVLNFPDVATRGDRILISVPDRSANIIGNEVPLLPAVLPEINFSTIYDISSSLPYYELNLTGTSVSIPLLIGNVSDTLSILAFQNGIIYSGRTPVLFEGHIPKQILVSMEVIPPANTDVDSAIHFTFPDDETTVSVEIYSLHQGMPLLISKSRVFKENPTLPVRIPQFLISGSYYVVIRSENIEEIEGFLVKDTLARYEISQVPYISYSAKGLKREQFIFDTVASEGSLKLSWRIPDKLDTQAIDPNLRILIPQCVSQENNREFLNSGCITTYVDVFAEDAKGENFLVWRIYGLFKKNEVILPSFLSRTILFDILKYAPEMKLKSIRLNYNAYFGNSLLTFKRTLIFNR